MSHSITYWRRLLLCSIVWESWLKSLHPSVSLMLQIKTFNLISPSCTLKMYKLKVKEQPLSLLLSFWHLLLGSRSELGTDKRAVPARQSRSHVQTLPSLGERSKERKSVAGLLDLACNVLLAQRGYLCNVSQSLLSHWICWHTVSGSWLWSTRSILRFCAAVDMATILVD